MKKAAIGIDIGGTSIKLGIVSDTGKVLLRDSFLTGSVSGRAELMDKLVEHIHILLKEAKFRKLKISGVGIGAPGPIDVEKGLVYFFPNIKGWENTPLKQILKKRLKLPVFVDNDANVMALGEYLFGAGKGSRNMIGLTLGTGLGGGIIIDGKLFHGPRYSAAEIGHMIVDPNGPLCGCGNHGCIETFVGNGYFVKDVQEHLSAGGDTILRDWVTKQHKVLTPKLVQDAAEMGDKLSIGQWHKTGTYLGTALAGLVNLLSPERIIIGGGLSLSGDLLFKPVIAAIQKKAFPIAAQFVKVLPAKLGTDAGLVGASALVFSDK